MENSMFKPADDVKQAYVKIGLYGTNGSGKTHTAARIAEGLALYLHERTGVLPPVVMVDTETGAVWIKPIFKKAGIPFFIAPTRSFDDAKRAIIEAEKNKAILIMDSVTHFWEDLKLSYAKKRKRFDNKLEIQDYGTVKPEWQEWVQLFLNSKAHIIICGRQSNEYEIEEKQLDDGRTKKEWQKAGTKMKAESEMGHEPALLIEMRSERSPDRKKKQQIIKAYVEKDRSTFLNGREFINPTFKVFLPHIEFLNIGGEHTGVDVNNNSEALFDDSGRPDWLIRKQQVEIQLEEIQSLLVKHYPGQTAEEKRKKVELLEKHFHTMSWTKIGTYSVEALIAGHQTLLEELEGSPITDDEIPDFSSPAPTEPTAPQSQAVEPPATPLEIPQIKVPRKDDGMEADWDGFVNEFIMAAYSVSDIASIQKLRKNHESPIGNLFKANKELHSRLVNTIAEREKDITA